MMEALEASGWNTRNLFLENTSSRYRVLQELAGFISYTS